MSERYQPDDWREQTTPGMAAVPPLPPSAPTTAIPAAGARAYPPGQGYPAQSYPSQGYQGRPGDPYAGGPGATTPDYLGRPVAFRRPDVVAGLLLVLAGVAVGVSLLLRWVTVGNATGWDLVRSAWHQLKASWSGFVDEGLWQPAAMVAGGVILFVLGLLMFVPARTHRTLGVLALLVSLGAGAGALVALSGADWHLGRFQIGFWCAAAAAVLGLIGSIKALATGPRIGSRAA
jgi:hypothetical protein